MMTNLKTAAHNPFTALENAAETLGDVKVAIILLTTYVNLGPHFTIDAFPLPFLSICI